MFAFVVMQEFRPFSIAGAIVIGLLAMEVGGSLVGASLSHLLQGASGLHGAGGHIGHDAHPGDDVLGKAFGWLSAGRVPVMVPLIAFVASFAVACMVLQLSLMRVAAPLPPTIASLAATLVALPCTRGVSRMAALLLPSDETYVIRDDDLIGRVGIVTLGPVAANSAARIKVQDRFGNWHFPRVGPAQPDRSIAEGSKVLIVNRTGGLLTVIAAEGHLAALKK
jgi:membrane protein implicated in regulation of membrane protease activity